MINIRREQPADYAAIYELVKQAFEHAEHTDHDEHNLVNRLRQSPFYLPELALVAETGGIIVGHIMFTAFGAAVRFAAIPKLRHRQRLDKGRTSKGKRARL